MIFAGRISYFSIEPDRTGPISRGAQFGIVVILYAVAAALVGFIAAIPESSISERLYGGASLGPLSPLAGIIVIILGALVARRMCDRRAIWEWVPGLLWLGLGAYDLLFAGGVLQTGAWQGSTPFRYLFDNLFGQCGDTECLYQVFSSAPFVFTVVYSVSSWITLKLMDRKNSNSERLSPQR